MIPSKKPIQGEKLVSMMYLIENITNKVAHQVEPMKNLSHGEDSWNCEVGRPFAVLRTLLADLLVERFLPLMSFVFLRLDANHFNHSAHPTVDECYKIISTVNPKTLNSPSKLYPPTIKIMDCRVITQSVHISRIKEY